MKTFSLSLLSAAVVLFARTATAEIIYDNSTTFEGTFNDSRLESGDEIVLAGSARLLTSFAFEYFADFTPTGDETARLRFYKMDGAPGGNEFATPGTLLYDSGAFGISSGYKSVNVDELSILLPSDKFTWSVEFSGLTGTESAGLLYYNPPTVGSSDDYFWQKENGVWSAVASDGTGNNFAAEVIATDAAANIVRIASLSYLNGTANLTINGAVPGKTYAFEYKSNLLAPAWTRAVSSTNATTDTLTLSDATASGAAYRFYRVVQLN